ncbi:MAG TPA: hypothetical protein GXZ58_06295 [Bacilli bacterium]|nr:hypothetical protein [Bacilli bacterium]
MGKLFVIGNGFDLDHELETGYTDFLNYLKEDYQRSIFIDNIEKIVACYSYELWSSFEKYLGNLNLDILLESVMAERKAFNSEFDYEPLDEGHLIDHVISSHITSLHKLDEYVKGWIETINLENVPPKRKYKHIFTKDSFFINFNYTNTLQELYGISHDKVFHIHGDVIDPIMGHGQDNHEQDFPTFETNDIGINEFGSAIVSQVSEFYNNSRKDTHFFCRKMNDFIDYINIEINEVCIIGHSLGEVDAVYFRELSYHYQDIPWTIYSRYSDQKGINKDKIQKLELLRQINNQLHINVVPFKE